MHALIINGIVEKYPYTIGNLRKDNPQTSFPAKPPDALLAQYNMVRVTPADQPSYDPITQNLIEDIPALTNGIWTQVWVVVDATPEEIEQRKADQLANIKAARAAAYTQEADPLFFKAERGEGTKSEWEAKVQEIRDRFPYPEEQE
jgi:hypothetical protein